MDQEYVEVDVPTIKEHARDLEIVETEENHSTNIDDERQKRYTHWKKNAKLLYEFLNTNNTKWPSLTCQLFPDVDVAGDTHRILLSSFTSSQLPQDESLYVGKLSSMKHLSWSSLNNFDMEEREFKIDNSLKLPSKNLVEDLRIKFPTGGDCNKARFSPANPDIIAAASSNGSVYVFDRTKHGSARQKLLSGSSNEPEYQIHCQLPTSAELEPNEALSLAWNWQRPGSLATTYAQGQLCVWDLQKFVKTSATLVDPAFAVEIDPQGTNDASWMVNHDSLLACCGEGNVLRLVDTRTDQKAQSVAETNPNHTGGINVCQFNYHKDLLLASADSTGKVNLWDVRNFQEPLQAWQHGDAVSAIQWSPHNGAVLATASQNDGLVKIWDLSQPDQDDQLIFTHGGHMFGVNDISWDLHDPWMMCSVSNDNSFQLWKPAGHLLAAK
ncbi:LAFA_0E10374g1_1 [Lachancea sp. 'fantastica']|nr:LAFA_0E10374g1_1 [Lachancea sp. 'fantastica']